MHSDSIRRLVVLLSVPASLYFLLQVGALVALLSGWGDKRLPSPLGSAVFALGLAAFLCSFPALVTLRRSSISGPLKYALMAVHSLWLVVGGLLLLTAVFLKILMPIVQRWIAT